MNRRALLWLLGTFVLVLFVVSWSAPPTVTVVVEGGIQFEPATIRLRVRVEPDKQNRGLSMGIFSDDYESSSWEQLEGDRSPIVRWVWYKGLPAGEYSAVAEVVRPGQENWRSAATFRVMERY